MNDPAGAAAIIVALIAAVVSVSTEIARRRDKHVALRAEEPKRNAERRALDAETYNKQLATISKLRDELEEEIANRRADSERFNEKLTELETRHAEEIRGLTARIRALEEENHSLLRENHKLRKGI